MKTNTLRAGLSVNVWKVEVLGAIGRRAPRPTSVVPLGSGRQGAVPTGNPMTMERPYDDLRREATER